ncbi:UNVERIFIED_CONTAM: hypothetical protein FKN15_055910 [Acipenser sinensis]
MALEEEMEWWHDHQRQLKAKGTPWCLPCLKHGHLSDVCPWEDPHFMKAFTQGEVETTEKWICLKALPLARTDQDTCLTCQKEEEEQLPAPKEEGEEWPSLKEGKEAGASSSAHEGRARGSSAHNGGAQASSTMGRSPAVSSTSVAMVGMPLGVVEDMGLAAGNGLQLPGFRYGKGPTISSPIRKGQAYPTSTGSRHVHARTQKRAAPVPSD